MQPAVAYPGEPMPIFLLANDASCTAFFFLLLPASSGYSVGALLLLRHHPVVQNFPKISFLYCSHQTNKFTPCMKAVVSYLAAEAFRSAHSKTSHI